MTTNPDLPYGEAVDVLAAAGEIAVSCHINPDGDALGSAVGFARAAVAAGKKAVVGFGEPYELPEYFSILPLDLLVAPADFPEAPEVMVTFDAADLSRLGSLSPAASAAGTLIVVDHHVTNTGFGHVNLIDGAAAASAVLAFELIQQLAWPLDEQAALALLLGLVTDTGRFQYSNTSAHALRVAADLVEYGAHPEVIGRMVYEHAPFGFLNVAGAVQSRAVLESDVSLVWSVLRAQDLASAGIDRSEADGLIDYIRIAREADVALLLTETSEGTKGSLRSRAHIDVGELASSLGGGGHARAAGFTLDATVEETVARVREHLGGD